jgi:hypothetical protein
MQHLFTQLLPRSAAALTLAAVLAARAGAQGPAIPVTIGQPVTGRITMDSPLLEGEDGIRYQRYSFRTGPRKIRVTLRSFELDSYIIVQKVSNGAVEVVGEDDDSGGDLDSQMVFDADGEYVVIARHFGKDATGGFTLTVDEPPPPPVVARGLSLGQRVEESFRATDPTLADGSTGHEYRMTLAAGTRVRLVLRSGDTDVRLNVGRGEGSAFSSMASNDNGAGGTDALLEFVADAAGTYVVRTTAAVAGAVGRYVLTVEWVR